MDPPSLIERLEKALEREVTLYIHHFCALPTRVDPLFVAPLGTPPEPTELESHFLSVSIKHEDQLIQVFAIEVLVYTTARLTTLFVSKADSTGYLCLLNLPRRGVSPVQTVVREFLLFLVQDKQTSEKRLVLSLFARAQDQYLFPGSIENEKKHVLDDRGLIKWWAKILEKTIRSQLKVTPNAKSSGDVASLLCRAHLVVPGCDRHETRTFIPRDDNYQISALWHTNDPLTTLGQPERTPERCLIPRFPDDPKARFAIDLDDELPMEENKSKSESQVDTSQTQALESEDTESSVPQAEPRFTSDRWRSVRSLAQFWELMSFRQECSAGRLVGFLWGIWEPPELADKPYKSTLNEDTAKEISPDSKNETNQPEKLDGQQEPEEEERSIVSTSRSSLIPSVSSLPISDMADQAPPQIQSPKKALLPSITECNPTTIDSVVSSSTPPLIKHTSAEVTLAPDAYTRCMTLLLTLDYCDLPTAIKSTKDFLGAVAKEAGREDWGLTVSGKSEPTSAKTVEPTSEANSLVGMVRKRPKAEEANTLSIGLIRKKPKA